MKSIEILHVTWVDSDSINEWSELAEIDHELKEIHTVGMLMHSTPEALYLALSYDPETDSVNAAMHIPKGCIKKIEALWTLTTK